MYCVIQQVMRKKPDRHGEPLEIIAYQNQWRLDESKPFTWAWMYSEERFERPHLEAYKITLAKKFHPDVNHGTDTTKQMQLINRLKESWGI